MQTREDLSVPTPTMMMDIGKWEAATIASRVWWKSEMTPSVRIRST